MYVLCSLLLVVTGYINKVVTENNLKHNRLGLLLVIFMFMKIKIRGQFSVSFERLLIWSTILVNDFILHPRSINIVLNIKDKQTSYIILRR